MLKCSFIEDDKTFTINIFNLLFGEEGYGSVNAQFLKSTVIGFSLDHASNVSIYLSSGAVFNLCNAMAPSCRNTNSHFLEFTDTEKGRALIGDIVKCLQNILSSAKE